MLTLHHLENSRSQRILWLLEELGVEYEIKRYERDPRTYLAPDSLKAMHPLGKSPLLTDGDTLVAESAVIINYLINQYGASKGLIPGNGTEAARQNEYWLHYSEGSLMPYLVLSLIVTKIKTSPMPFFAKPIAKAIASRAVMQMHTTAGVHRPWQGGGAHRGGAPGEGVIDGEYSHEQPPPPPGQSRLDREP